MSVLAVGLGCSSTLTAAGPAPTGPKVGNTLSSRGHAADEARPGTMPEDPSEGGVHEVVVGSEEPPHSADHLVAPALAVTFLGPAQILGVLPERASSPPTLRPIQ